MEERRAAALAARPTAVKEALTQALANGLFEKVFEQWNDHGTKPLIDAVCGGNIEDAKLFLEARVNPSVRNKNFYNGSTPLHYDIVESEHVELAMLLLKKPKELTQHARSQRAMS